MDEIHSEIQFMDSLLIIDDERDNLEALQRLLRNQYEITTTTSPFDALKLIQKELFSVIVSDQRMPEMTGIELLEKAKNVAPLSTRILLTGYTDLESVIGAINRGNVYRYIAKPWDPDDLKITLKQAADAHHLRSELEEKNRALSRSNTDLKTALDELKVLDRAKASFMSLISHELNTPLTVLNSFSSLLTENSASFSPDLKKACLAISGASNRFSEIISEVLSYIQTETDERLNLVEFDFAEATTELKKSLGKELLAKKIEIKIEGQGKARCDPKRMKEALRKLLVESLAQTPEGKAIHVRLGARQDAFCYQLSHPGEPYSKDPLLPLAVPLKELHHKKGLGLSLAICKLIIESHGGEMRFDQAHSGTTFTLSLPIH